jgi:uncharacterized protein
MNEVAAAGPVTAKERIVSIDVLRGFAVLGILVMNVQSFSMISEAYVNPTAYGDLTGGNYLVWLVSHLFADSKFMTIFSLLFGAGVVLMADRRVAAGKKAAGVHCRRMLWLIVFGAAHGLLLWYGDILFAYGVCGLWVYLFRRRSNKTLIVVGLLMFSVGSLIPAFWQLTMPYWGDGMVEQVESEWWVPTDEAVAEKIDGYRGGWSEQQTVRQPMSMFMMTNHFLTETLWRAGGLMLIGMALFRLGALSAARSRELYLRLAGVGFGLGLPIVYWGVLFCESSQWGFRSAMFVGGQFNYWASLLVAAGWTGLVMLACKDGWLRPVLGRLAAVGRMALSCYLLQTIICTTIFYGHGLGLFGSVSRVGQAGVAVAVWVAMFVFCPAWLHRFRFGPFEWLWRSLTYWNLQPMRVER